MNLPARTSAFEERLHRKVTWRLIPFLFLCYIFAYVDRVNVGFAKLQMQQDLGMSDTVYGVGMGIFFIGYFFFEVPCNMALQKVGARLWLGPIMIVWGLVSACTMLVKGAMSFYAIRFLLGIVESGFFPGVILYLTFWFTRRHRARMVAAFMTAVPLSGVIGGPISGWILETMSRVGGLRGWQWLYVYEALPSIIAGIVTLIFLADNPQRARWLTREEREVLLEQLAEDEHFRRQASPGHHSFGAAFRSGRVWLLALIYFGFVMGNYGVSFWLPQIIKETLTKDPAQIGLLSAIPWAVAAVVMVLVGRHSDETGERRWHIFTVGMICAVAFALSGWPGISGVAGLIALTAATSGIMSATSTFWALPTGLLTGAGASAGIAWINSIGNVAGYVSPFVVGHIRDQAHSMTPALLVLAGSSLVSALVTVVAFRGRETRREAAAPEPRSVAGSGV